MCAVHVASISVCWVWWIVRSPWVLIQWATAHKNTHFGIRLCGKLYWTSMQTVFLCLSVKRAISWRPSLLVLLFLLLLFKDSFFSSACLSFLLATHTSPLFETVAQLENILAHKTHGILSSFPSSFKDCPSVCADESCAQTNYTV